MRRFIDFGYSTNEAFIEKDEREDVFFGCPNGAVLFVPRTHPWGSPVGVERVSSSLVGGVSAGGNTYKAVLLLMSVGLYASAFTGTAFMYAKYPQDGAAVRLKSHDCAESPLILRPHPPPPPPPAVVPSLACIPASYPHPVCRLPVQCDRDHHQSHYRHRDIYHRHDEGRTACFHICLSSRHWVHDVDVFQVIWPPSASTRFLRCCIDVLPFFVSFAPDPILTPTPAARSLQRPLLMA